WLVLVPTMGRSDRHLLLQEATRFGQRGTARVRAAMTPQQTIDRGGAHLRKTAARRFRQSQFAVALQCLHELSQKRRETLACQEAAQTPHLHQSGLLVHPVQAPANPSPLRPGYGQRPHRTHRVLAVPTRRLTQRIQYPTLPGSVRLVVLPAKTT